MKRVLFLDDDFRRTDEFLARMRNKSCTVVTTATARECIALLGDGTYDLVLLDHDLEGETFCDSSRDDCGMEVVRWLKANGGQHGAFMIHTMNAVAAAAMYLELNAMGYTVQQAPFGSLEFYEHVYTLLELKSERSRRPPRSLKERVKAHIRGLRGR